MKRIVLFFSATGNSLWVARQLAGEKGETLSISQLIREGRYEIEADEIGLVYPIYGHMPAHLVREYLKKVTLKADYKFSVLTFGCRKCNSVEILDGITAKAGWHFDYINTVMMVDNWLPHFDVNEQKKMDKHIPEQMEPIISDIRNRRHYFQPTTDLERQQHQGFLYFSGLDPEVGFLKESADLFTVTDTCIHCGICTKVCPRGNYKIVDERAVPQGECEMCLACIHNCPKNAIRFRTDTHEPLTSEFPEGEANPNARYRNPNVKVTDIIKANTML